MLTDAQCSDSRSGVVGVVYLDDAGLSMADSDAGQVYSYACAVAPALDVLIGHLGLFVLFRADFGWTKSVWKMVCLAM